MKIEEVIVTLFRQFHKIATPAGILLSLLSTIYPSDFVVIRNPSFLTSQNLTIAFRRMEFFCTVLYIISVVEKPHVTVQSSSYNNNAFTNPLGFYIKSLISLLENLAQCSYFGVNPLRNERNYKRDTVWCYRNLVIHNNGNIIVFLSGSDLFQKITNI